MIQKIPFLPGSSSRPGVTLEEANFTHFGTGRVPFAGGRFLVEPGATSKPDTHAVSECWMIAQGRGLINYDGVDYPVTVGDYLLFEPQKTHFIHNDGDQTIVIHTVWWLEHAK